MPAGKGKGVELRGHMGNIIIAIVDENFRCKDGAKCWKADRTCFGKEGR